MTGWFGRHFEDFTQGERIDHGVSRTVTENDNHAFTLLTYNTNLTHTNDDVAAQSEFGRPLMNSTFTLALVIGISVRDTSENAVANLGWEEIELFGPVFAGDTLYASTEVLELRQSKSRPDAGIVRFRHYGYKTNGEIIIRFTRTAMIWKRGHGPRAAWPMPDLASIGR